MPGLCGPQENSRPSQGQFAELSAVSREPDQPLRGRTGGAEPAHHPELVNAAGVVHAIDSTGLLTMEENDGDRRRHSALLRRSAAGCLEPPAVLVQVLPGVTADEWRASSTEPLWGR